MALVLIRVNDLTFIYLLIKIPDRFVLLSSKHCNLENLISSPRKGHLISHLGCKHGYINDVLREKNFSVLPCAVNNTYSASKQKTLARIKKEREEKNSEGNPSTDELRRELMMEDDKDTNLSSGQASTDEILNKYKDQIN